MCAADFNESWAISPSAAAQERKPTWHGSRVNVRGGRSAGRGGGAGPPASVGEATRRRAAGSNARQGRHPQVRVATCRTVSRARAALRMGTEVARRVHTTQVCAWLSSPYKALWRRAHFPLGAGPNYISATLCASRRSLEFARYQSRNSETAQCPHCLI